MLHCIFHRKSFGFADPAWLDEPWVGVQKRIEQRIWDQGLKLTAIMERSDDCAQGMADLAGIQQLVRECNEAISQIESLKQELAMEDEADKRLSAERDERSHDGAEENALNCLMLKLTATTIELLLHEAAHDLLQRAREMEWSSMRATDSDTGRFVLELAIVELEVPPQGRLFELAEELVEGADDLYTRRKGSTFVARLLFPLHAAVRHLPPGSPLWDECSMLMDQLQGQKGTLPHLDLDERGFTFLGHARQKSVVAIGALQGQRV